MKGIKEKIRNLLGGLLSLLKEPFILLFLIMFMSFGFSYLVSIWIITSDSLGLFNLSRYYEYFINLSSGTATYVDGSLTANYKFYQTLFLVIVCMLFIAFITCTILNKLSSKYLKVVLDNFHTKLQIFILSGLVCFVGLEMFNVLPKVICTVTFISKATGASIQDNINEYAKMVIDERNSGYRIAKVATGDTDFEVKVPKSMFIGAGIGNFTPPTEICLGETILTYQNRETHIYYKYKVTDGDINDYSLFKNMDAVKIKKFWGTDTNTEKKDEDM